MLPRINRVLIVATTVLLLLLVMVSSMIMLSTVQAQGIEPQANCSGGSAPTVPGPVTLNRCFQKNIVIGGNNRIIRVWYITDTTAYTVGPEVYQHWIAGESQASDVADAVAESWQVVYDDSGIGGAPHEPYINGCSSVLNIQLEDGKGWSGIAYWGSPGNCNIGIDSPMILNGVGTGDDGVIAHEVQHYTQYSYDDGCYNDFQPLYPSNSWIEGWANWAGKNALNAANDADYSVTSYDAGNSYYNLSYTDLHKGYLIQHYGHNGAPGDRNFGVKAVYEHYRQCDLADDLFVMDQTINALTGGSKNEQKAFLDFLAANYGYKYANPTTQPELVYPDNDDKPNFTPGFSHDVTLASGSQSWTESTPSSWTARYYRFKPSGSCGYVQLHAETSPPGGLVGINFLGAKTSSPTQLLRSAHIGDNATRFFAGAGALDELVVVVNSFDTTQSYQVTATCVAPTLTILEPLQNPGHAMVGAPSSPIATLTRFKITSAGLGVSGVVSSSIAFNAEGASPTLVPGSFQEVGPGEYWAVIIPPLKPAGTTFVDYQVTLSGGAADTKPDALLYVDPGNVDMALLFDESGSMNTQDTPGEGTRIVNARKAGSVIPDLLRNGDRVAVLGFGASDIPAGCGLPPDGSGTGNCPDATITRMARTDVVLPGTVAVAEGAVNAVTTRPVWTNIGQGLVDAKDLLLANPGNTTPDFIYLLSDGRENVNPLYVAVRAQLQASGVHINTIGFGPEAPGALLSQIAADTGGTYRPVSTSGLGTSGPVPVLLTSIDGMDAMAAQKSVLEALGTPEALIAPLVASAPYLPGQLVLADVYDYFDTDSQDASRLFHFNFVAVPNNTFQEASGVVDSSSNELTFVVAGKQEDFGFCQGGYSREVEILPPGFDPAKRWFPISPRDGSTPVDWDIRNNTYDDTVIIKNPAVGLWRIRTLYSSCQTSSLSDFMMNASVQSTIHLQGRFFNLTDGQASAGSVVPIVANLMTKSGLLPGAFVVAAIENEGGTDFVVLGDDGNNHDGAAGDGIYGWNYSQTDHGGSYGVRVLALFPDPANPSVNLIREWNGGFWVDGPQDNRTDYPGDQDKDGMPDDWEKRCKLIVGQDDSQQDPDHDGLTNIAELGLGTLPCRDDTDHGGERDGSEVTNSRNPLWPNDDKVRPVGHVELMGLDRRIWINWSKSQTETLTVYVSNSPGQLGSGLNIGGTGSYTLTQLPGGGTVMNGTPYYLTFQRSNASAGAEGTYSDQYTVTPNEDPVPPQGAFLIDGPNIIEGGDATTSKQVILSIDATDQLELKGPASHSIAHALLNVPGIASLAPSGISEMRFVNTDQAQIEGVSWEAYGTSKPWTLDCQVGQKCVTYAQFRDRAGNESLIVDQQIRLAGAGDVYLPIIIK